MDKLNKLKSRKILAVVLCWNNKDIIKPCVDSLLAQTETVEILVVDNGSKDGSYDSLENTYGEKIKLVKNPTNLGFAGGANIGFNWAKENGFDYVALLNSDAVADSKWLAELKLNFTDSKVGISTSKILKLDGKGVDTTGEELYYWGIASPRGRGEIDSGQYDKKEEVFGGSGGASMYRMKMIEDVGMFDEDFFAYCEDVDLSFRSRLFGWMVMYNPKATVRHAIGASSSKISGLTVRMSIKNQPMLLIKNIPLRYLPGVSIRYSALWSGAIISGFKTGNGKQVTLGVLKFMVLIPKKNVQRLKIQHKRRSRGVRSSDVRMLLKPGFPEETKNYLTVKIAKKIIFWDKS